MIDKKLGKKRIEVCKKCDRFFKPTQQCKECGCFMFIKTKIIKANCPLDKWNEYFNREDW